MSTNGCGPGSVGGGGCGGIVVVLVVVVGGLGLCSTTLLK
jgi:hypothetical protein